MERERKERDAENELKTVRKACGRWESGLSIASTWKWKNLPEKIFKRIFFSPRRHRDFLSLPHRFELCAKV